MPRIEFNDLDNMFQYHAPTGTQAERYQEIREAAKEFAKAVLNKTPESPEQTLAIRDIQRAVMMANAAIAINENPI